MVHFVICGDNIVLLHTNNELRLMPIDVLRSSSKHLNEKGKDKGVQMRTY